MRINTHALSKNFLATIKKFHHNYKKFPRNDEKNFLATVKKFLYNYKNIFSQL